MRLIGYSTEEVMGRSLVQEFITDDFKTAVQAVLDQALAGDETDNFEFPLITKGGARIEVLLNATTRRDEQGNVIGVVGIGQVRTSCFQVGNICVHLMIMLTKILTYILGAGYYGPSSTRKGVLKTH